MYGENNNLHILTNVRNGNIHKKNVPLAGGNSKSAKQHHQSEFYKRIYDSKVLSRTIKEKIATIQRGKV